MKVKEVNEVNDVKERSKTQMGVTGGASMRA